MVSKNLSFCLSVTNFDLNLKKFATLAATAVFVIPFWHQNQPFSESHFWQEIVTLTRTICRGIWNLPHKFHLYLNHSSHGQCYCVIYSTPWVTPKTLTLEQKTVKVPSWECSKSLIVYNKQIWCSNIGTTDI